MTANGVPIQPRIYLDNNATTQVAPAVVEAMLPCFTYYYGNPSSTHIYGAKAQPLVRTAREQVAALIGCAPSEIVFTSGGTEADNLAIAGRCRTCPDKTHVVTSSVEHPAVVGAVLCLEKTGCQVTTLDVDQDGCLDLDLLTRALRPGLTALVALMWANNETGVLFPIAEIAEICAAAGVPLHVDAVQAIGKLPLNLAEHPGITTLALSAHKIHGPKGVGALFVRSGTPLEPLIFGGHQERGLRSGTENVPGIVGLGVAAELMTKHGARWTETTRALRDHFETRLMTELEGVERNGHAARRLPNTANLAFLGAPAEGILQMLSQRGIAASAGSACSSGSLEPSRVLKAMGFPRARAASSIRFSLSHLTTPEQIDETIAALQEIVPALRAMQPYQDAEAIAAYRETVQP